METSLRLLALMESVELAAGAFFQAGAGESSPLSCQQSHTGQCIGRSDRNRLLGLSAQAREIVAGQERGVVMSLMAGGGVYQRWTTSVESEFSGGGVTDNGVSQARTSVGYTLGTRLTITRWAYEPYLDFQVHDLLEPKPSKAGAVLLSVGLYPK